VSGLECDCCSSKNRISLASCGYCKDWICDDCTEEEVVHGEQVLCCQACWKQRKKALERWSRRPSCGTCGWPVNWHRCEDGCRNVPKPVPKKD